MHVSFSKGGISKLRHFQCFMGLHVNGPCGHMSSGTLKRMLLCLQVSYASFILYLHIFLLNQPFTLCRGMPRGDNSDRPDPAVKWKGYRTLLLFWLSAGIVTFLSSLFWLQAGMWAGAIGIIGSSLSLSGCYSQRRLILDVHVIASSPK